MRGKERKPQTPIDPQSNYRQHFMNKHKFYEDVMQKEEPPFHFKIHLFIRSKDKHQMSSRELSLALMDLLGDYGATKIREN